MTSVRNFPAKNDNKSPQQILSAIEWHVRFRIAVYISIVCP